MNDNQNGGITIKKSHIVIAVLIIILLLAGGIAVGANWNKWFGAEQPAAAVTEATDKQKPTFECYLHA
jgi:flagellar basal body-associated protein FliL